MSSPALFARPCLFAALALSFAGGTALVGCELAVHPDVGLAEVPAPTCVPCLDAADTVITEPDGNVVIVPVDSLVDAGDDVADADSTSVDP